LEGLLEGAELELEPPALTKLRWWSTPFGATPKGAAGRAGAGAAPNRLVLLLYDVLMQLLSFIGDMVRHGGFRFGE